jgi:hypothetical protein
MHKGPDNSGRTFFMGANVKLQPLSLSPVEAALIEQRGCRGRRSGWSTTSPAR